jgi:hypothetical protein
MTAPQEDAEEPAPRRETGVGWPGEWPPPEPKPEVKPRRRDIGARPDTTVERPRQASRGAEFASAAQRYRSTQTRPAWSYQMPPERPGTVTAAAVILFISAGLGLLLCCGINVLAGEAELDDNQQNLLFLFSAIIAVFSVANIVLGYYVLQGRQWARITTIVLCVLGILSATVSVFVAIGGDGGGNSLGTCVGIILNIVIIGLLSGSSASDYFRYARG